MSHIQLYIWAVYERWQEYGAVPRAIPRARRERMPKSRKSFDIIKQNLHYQIIVPRKPTP